MGTTGPPLRDEELLIFLVGGCEEINISLWSFEAYADTDIESL